MKKNNNILIENKFLTVVIVIGLFNQIYLLDSSFLKEVP